MSKIELKFVEHSGGSEQEVNLLPLDKFDGNVIVNDASINLSVLRFPLEPGALNAGLIRVRLDVTVLYLFSRHRPPFFASS
ncbi:hypothetical protein PanWU01x14_179150 [Parasponia andersonii]|uniref:Uncharacterized protein n=1 Tax=Parasponia andersonii TaxID=3476 RepID=A0A2P5C6P0_PARAD|nr:hypothetical protein PanWU01x14_179150 [Parasponia andersonii]